MRVVGPQLRYAKCSLPRVRSAHLTLRVSSHGAFAPVLGARRACSVQAVCLVVVHRSQCVLCLVKHVRMFLYCYLIEHIETQSSFVRTAKLASSKGSLVWRQLSWSAH